MLREFIHPELGKDVRSLAGYYTAMEESTLIYKGNTVICILGAVCLDSYCCGGGNWNYVQVPGYLVKENFARSESGRPISQVEPITSEDDREKIKLMILEKYPHARVEFD